MKSVKNIIKEILGVLEEDFSSIREIKNLANDALVFAAKANLDYVKRQIEESDKVYHIYPILLLDVYQQNPKKYPTLQNFLINSNIQIMFKKSNDMSRLGNYTALSGDEYDTTAYRNINLFYGDKLSADLTEKFKERSKFEYYEIYSTFYYAFESTLEHEIQHGYDDFRSNTKIFKTRGAIEHEKKYYYNGHALELNDPMQSIEKHKSYQNQQHEIEARFTQAVNSNRTRFSTIDFKKSADGLEFIEHSMYPIDKVFSDFKNNFEGWKNLPEEIKRRLIHRVSQYWHKVADEIPEKNRQEIEQQRTKAKEMELAEIKKIIKNAIHS